MTTPGALSRGLGDSSDTDGKLLNYAKDTGTIMDKTQSSLLASISGI